MNNWKNIFEKNQDFIGIKILQGNDLEVITTFSPLIDLSVKSIISKMSKSIILKRGWGKVRHQENTSEGFSIDVLAIRPISQNDLIDLANDTLEEIEDVIPFYQEHLQEIEILIHPSYLKHFMFNAVSGVGQNTEGYTSRIHCVVKCTEQELNDFIEISKQKILLDHRNEGERLDLFHFQDDSPGMAFWHPRGYILWHLMEEYLRSINRKYSFQEVRTPIIAKSHLWQKSGHLEKFTENIFKLEQEQLVIKPMNCPLHIQIFNKMHFSEKKMPVKLFEFGLVHRKEPSGALHGLFRAVSFTQDDAHIFCTDTNMKDMIKECILTGIETYKDFGFLDKDIMIKLSLRPENSIGTDEMWEYAESTLRTSLEDLQMKFDTLKGEGAFYGPKIEFHLRDIMNRTWQCGTIQVDLFMPERLNCSYINSQNVSQTPILIHRAILGSLERFIAILLEQHKGYLPLFLSPEQIVLCSVNSAQDEYTCAVASHLIKSNVRAVTDIRVETLGKKVRDALIKRIPLIAVVGEKEKDNNTVTLRQQDKCFLTLKVDELIKFIKGD